MSGQKFDEISNSHMALDLSLKITHYLQTKKKSHFVMNHRGTNHSPVKHQRQHQQRDSLPIPILLSEARKRLQCHPWNTVAKPWNWSLTRRHVQRKIMSFLLFLVYLLWENLSVRFWLIWNLLCSLNDLRLIIFLPQPTEDCIIGICHHGQLHIPTLIKTCHYPERKKKTVKGTF